MSAETAIGLICMIPVVSYFLIYEINWEAVKTWIFS